MRWAVTLPVSALRTAPGARGAPDESIDRPAGDARRPHLIAAFSRVRIHGLVTAESV